MRNLDVVKNFVNGLPGKTRNLKSDGSTLYSYNTAIATHFPIGVVVNTSKYSVSTTKVQSALRAALSSVKLNTVEVVLPQYNLRRNDLVEAVGRF